MNLEHDRLVPHDEATHQWLVLAVSSRSKVNWVGPIQAPLEATGSPNLPPGERRQTPSRPMAKVWVQPRASNVPVAVARSPKDREMLRIPRPFCSRVHDRPEMRRAASGSAAGLTPAGRPCQLVAHLLRTLQPGWVLRQKAARPKRGEDRTAELFEVAAATREYGDQVPLGPDEQVLASTPARRVEPFSSPELTHQP